MSKASYMLKPQARLDALEIALYIGEDNPPVAREFLRDFHSTCQILSEMPEIGSRRDFQNHLLSEIRMLPMQNFHNYLIFYRPRREKGIEVIRILHAARDFPTLFR